MFQTFNHTGANRSFPSRPVDPRFAGLTGKLYVNDPGQWDEAVGMNPAEFYRLWTDGLPGEPFLAVDLCGGGQGKLTISSSGAGGRYFEAKRRFDKRRGTMELDEVRVENPAFRRKGIGKVLLHNQFNVARRWGIDMLTLRAGREDGAFFWARRNAYIASFRNVSPERQPVSRFCNDIEEGLNKLGDKLSVDFVRRVRESLKTAGQQVNCVIARLPNPEDVAALFKHVGEYHAYFNLSDEKQMAQVRENLGDINKFKDNIRAEFRAETPKITAM